jgi:hypothetical protein
MKYRQIPQVLLISAAVLAFACAAPATENIDPDNDGSQYSYGENVGWFNWEPNTGDGVEVTGTQLTGYIWAENIGWINMSPTAYGGVTNDGAGNLSGYAWGENVGWINFSPTYGGVTIDAKGTIEGWAWGENIGWIHLQSSVYVTIAMTGTNQYTLTWNSVLNYIYHVLTSDDLDSWTTADDNVVGGDGTTDWVDTTAAVKKFYKVKQASPPGYRVKTAWRP